MESQFQSKTNTKHNQQQLSLVADFFLFNIISLLVLQIVLWQFWFSFDFQKRKKSLFGMYNSEIYIAHVVHSQPSTVHTCVYCVCLLYTHKRKETFIMVSSISIKPFIQTWMPLRYGDHKLTFLYECNTPLVKIGLAVFWKAKTVHKFTTIWNDAQQ